MIELEGDFNFATSERFLERLAADPGQPLMVKSRPVKGALGGQTANLQAIITWAKTTSERTVRTYLDPADPDGLADLGRELHGLAVMILADRLMYRNGAVIEAALVQAVRTDMLNSMSNPQLARLGRGPNTTIICADNLPPFDFPKSLYSAPERLIEDARYGLLTAAIADSLSLRPRRWPDFMQMSGLLFELAQNTHDHARLSERLDVIRSSIRGLHARLWVLNEPVVASLSRDSPGIARFLSSRRERLRLQQAKQIAELSVFDSGPGFARRLGAVTGQNIDAPQDEMDMVAQCFMPFVSSKSDSSAGMGLQRALRLLCRSGGFLRVRSGRVSIYADLRV